MMMLRGDVSPCNSAYFTYRVRFYTKAICDHWVVAPVIFIPGPDVLKTWIT